MRYTVIVDFEQGSAAAEMYVLFTLKQLSGSGTDVWILECDHWIIL
jgi:hypothetical protein